LEVIGKSSHKRRASRFIAVNRCDDERGIGTFAQHLTFNLTPLNRLPDTEKIRIDRRSHLLHDGGGLAAGWKQEQCAKQQPHRHAKGRFQM